MDLIQQIDSLSAMVHTKIVGLTGLTNLGNTCYLNAILQCLRHTDTLNRYLAQEEIARVLRHNQQNNQLKENEALLLINYIKIVNLMWEHTNIRLSPLNFRFLLAQTNDQFNNSQQHDAHELLITLLQTFHDVLSKSVRYRITGRVVSDMDRQIKKAHDDWINYYKNKHSVIIELFGGQLRTQMTCLACHHYSYRYDPVLVIDLPIENATSLLECFNHQFTETEQLSGEDAYQCDYCHAKTRANRRLQIWTLPDILVIKFNRFQHQYIGGQFQSKKNDTLITFPTRDLNLSTYLLMPSPSESSIYDLHAICCHRGAMNVGHYYAICYNSVIGSWVVCDDQMIVPVPEEKLTGINDAYLLFYHRKPSATANVTAIVT
jgi:ubiquitin carboxyl-terminal hydrolase 8